MKTAKQMQRKARTGEGEPGQDRHGPRSDVRVLGLYAHIDAGKTTTSEGILYHCGRIHRPGRVDDGNTQLDWMPQERQRGITITSAATSCRWGDHWLNLIDTPGHVDFCAEVVRSMRVIDGAVMVLCGVGGVEPQTESVWTLADREQLPRILFINMLDRPGSDASRALDEVSDQLSPGVLALQIPIGDGREFSGVVDLVNEEALIWDRDTGSPTVAPIPPEYAEQAAAARIGLVESVCEVDERALEQWLEHGDVESAVLRQAVRRATISGGYVPALCGSAMYHIGLQPLLDAIVAYLPAPSERSPARGVPLGEGECEGEWSTGGDNPLCATAFKIVIDRHVGHLTWVRVLSGQLAMGGTVLNPRCGAAERVSRIYRMHANKRERIQAAVPGDVVALVGVRSAVTGDTLCDPDRPRDLASLRFPQPVMKIALSAGSEDNPEQLDQALRRLCQEDPTLVHAFDTDTHEETLAGIGELHLEVAVDRLRTEFGVTAKMGPAQVAYREAVRRPAEETATYRHQSGGHGHFAQVRLRVEPLSRNGGVVFEDDSGTPGGPDLGRGRRPGVPTELRRDVELGVRETLAKGILAGYPVEDIKVTLVGGRYHAVDSCGLDFRIAGSMAVRRAARAARLALIEPVMQLDLAVPEEYLGAVMSDLGRRRSKVESVEPRDRMRHIAGEVPLDEARGYASRVRGLTQGRCTFMLEFRRYDFVPDSMTKAIVERRRAEGKIQER